MSIVVVLLIFAGVPIAYYLVTGALVFLPGAVRTPRYRPGDDWTHDPVWFGPNPALLDPDTRALAATARPASTRPAIGGSDRPAIASRQQGSGASPGDAGAQADRGRSGATAAAAVLEVPVSRGGAHGEW